jgi:hypothetical protein
MGRFLGIKFADLWSSWFKANVWSLLAGIPALIFNQMLTGWFLPVELGKRFRFYSLFILFFIIVFFAATCLAEFLYARRVIRIAGVQVRRAAMIKGVLLANLVSYAVLGPIYFLIEYPRTEVRQFSSDARWSKQPELAVLAVGKHGQLETTTVDGQNHRVVVPYEVLDYVVSADLAQVLYLSAGERFSFFSRGTNHPIPEVGFSCRAPEMDFSPGGKFVAFFKRGAHQMRVFDRTTQQFKEVPTFGEDYDCSVVWSSKEDTIYFKCGKEYWEISLEPAVAYRSLTQRPEDFANHFGRVGNSWSRDGVGYTYHQNGDWHVSVIHGWGSQMIVSDEKQPVIRLKDPAGQLGTEQAVFLEGASEILFGFGGFVYVLDVASKRIGPVIQGHDFIALAKPFCKASNL